MIRNYTGHGHGRSAVLDESGLPREPRPVCVLRHPDWDAPVTVAVDTDGTVIDIGGDAPAMRAVAQRAATHLTCSECGRCYRVWPAISRYGRATQLTIALAEPG